MIFRFTLDHFSIKLLNLQQSQIHISTITNTICNNHKIQFAPITKYNLQQLQIQYTTITNIICNNHKIQYATITNIICNNHKIQFATITNTICNNHKYNLQWSQIQFATITKYNCFNAGFIPITQLTCISLFRLRRGILTYVIILCLINMFLYN